jgi:hypothetical protein
MLAAPKPPPKDQPKIDNNAQNELPLAIVGASLNLNS